MRSREHVCRERALPAIAGVLQLAFVSLLFGAAFAGAQVSTSSSFRLYASMTDSAGGRSSSSSFVLEDCLGVEAGAAGRSTSASFVLVGPCAAQGAAPADLELSKVADVTTVAPGDVVTFTLVVTNHGPGTAVGVVVSDPLPVGLTLVATSGCAEDPAGVPSCSLGSIPPLGTAQFEIQATVDADAPATIVNTASASATTPDPGPATNVASVTLTVSAPPSILGIPALDGIGLAFLSVLLAGLGLARLRFRREKSG